MFPNNTGKPKPFILGTQGVNGLAFYYLVGKIWGGGLITRTILGSSHQYIIVRYEITGIPGLGEIIKKGVSLWVGY